MSAPFGSDDFLRVSYSSLNTFVSCARKFEFNKLYPRRARDYDTFAADVGKALHHGYQNYLITRDADKALWAMMESYPYESEWNQNNDFRSLQTCVVVLQEMIDSAEMLEYRVAQIRRPLSPDELKRELELQQAMGTSYDQVRMNGVIVPAIEVPFELRLNGINLPDGRGIAVVGFVDAFLINIMTERFRTMDIKTHRSTIKDATAKYKFNGQQVPYGIVLEHIQDRPVDEFDVLYLDCYVDLAEPKVELYEYEKDKASIQEWLVNAVVKCQQIQRFMEMGYFPRTDGGCMFYNKPCYFLEICTIRDREQIVKWLLEGEAPEHEEPTIPWVLADLDVYGNQESVQ